MFEMCFASRFFLFDIIKLSSRMSFTVHNKEDVEVEPHGIGHTYTEFIHDFLPNSLSVFNPFAMENKQLAYLISHTIAFHDSNEHP